MALTLHDIKVWNTGEVIDLIVPADTDETVDASAMTIAPGFEDPHVHFRDPGQTYKESMVSGCRASASGGRTHHAEHRSRHGWREGQSRSAGRFRGA